MLQPLDPTYLPDSFVLRPSPASFRISDRISISSIDPQDVKLIEVYDDDDHHHHQYRSSSEDGGGTLTCTSEGMYPTPRVWICLSVLESQALSRFRTDIRQMSKMVDEKACPRSGHTI